MWQKIKNYYHFAQALLAALYFNFPSKKLIIIGVTGTDGKTTTANMIYHVLTSANKKVSMISSVNAQIGGKSHDTGFHVSTPSPFQVQKYLKKAADEGSEYFVLESTSHGLDQNRLAFVDFKVAVLTNITHEHLDYHNTFDRYLKAKSKLFKNADFAILNMDDPKSYKALKEQVENRLFSYSLKNNADVNLKNLPVNLTVPGRHNIYNALAAASACIVLKIDRQKILKALKTFKGIRGRMEKIDEGQSFNVIIDFAHTPNGLDNALSTMKSNLGKGNRLIAIFGAAGERDSSKRKIMGSVADQLADVIVLTAEDPRSEEAQNICKQILLGIKTKKINKDCFIITDREKAIEFAIKIAKKGDIVAVLGKGHEKSMNINGEEIPWDEIEVTKRAIKKVTNEA